MEMLENGKYNSRAMIGASEDNCTIPSEGLDQLTYKLVRVEGDGSFIPASEDDVMEVEHLLEPKHEVLEDKCLAIEDFPCPDDYSQIKTDNGILDSDSTREGKQESKFEFLDGMLPRIDDEGNLNATNCISGDCTDYLLDSGFAEKNSHLDYDEGPCLGNLGSENLSPGLSERDDGATEISDFASAIIPLHQSTSDQSTFLLDNMTIRELHEAFRSTFGRETSVKDKQWLKRRILFGLQNLIELENGCSLLETGPSSIENEDDLIYTSGYGSTGRMYRSFTSIPGKTTQLISKSVGKEADLCSDILGTGFTEARKIGYGHLNSVDRESSLVTRKRLRKPTRRYIEELSDVTSRQCVERLETPFMNSTGKLRVKSQNQHHWKGVGTMPLVCRQDAPGGSAIQVPFGHRVVRRGRPRKNCTSFTGHASKDNKEHRLLSVAPKKNCGLGSPQSESQDDMSDDNVATIRSEKGIRRKHHRLWNLSEVMKLIEGVSRYGVGRWTDIKRLLFSSSVHRTSVDLKDKWRNLLRASCVQLPGKKEAEQRKKHTSLPIPQSVLRRVRELAVIYPYPRERKSRLKNAAASAATPISATGTNTSISRSGRVVHKKNLV
ncbi:uncharacterized protein LOC143855498 [Tasmannia lanceolata]|uniref:uncharacterized protein LOC143855498 n=1 Tax=Tasmannia lanceolata TaxID=3420 RepID=UPI00406473E6